MKFSVDWKKLAAFGAFGGIIGLGSSTVQILADLVNLSLPVGPGPIGFAVATIVFSVLGGALVGIVKPEIAEIIG